MYKNLNKLMLFGFMLCTELPANAAIDNSEQPVNAVSYSHVLNWTLGLVIVLCLFFACVWVVRKTGALSVNTKTHMKVVSGLSLGMREKLILVQVGEKQLVLGVTPGRIDNLLVLEGSEQLFKEEGDKGTGDGFADKLKQVMNRAQHE